ncbi:MAG: hypothetical protein K2J71_04485 [Oscillospiraceae bacterium]|nr:hypothetical protein [Oscillospiraceae bacterium]
MRHYMTVYLQYIENLLNDAEHLESAKIPVLRREILVQIGFMQHERLVHFLVVILIGLAFFLSMGCFLYFRTMGLGLLCGLLLILLIPYIWHYYFLENTTQKFYILYNRLAALDDQADYPNTDKMEDF